MQVNKTFCSPFPQLTFWLAMTCPNVVDKHFFNLTWIQFRNSEFRNCTVSCWYLNEALGCVPTSKWRLLHQLPAVSREQQVHRVVLQVAFVLQVGADQLSDSRCPVCADNNTTTGLVMLMSHCIETFQKEPKSRCYAKVTAAKPQRVSPGNRIISAGLPLCCSAWTSFLHCVVLPALSTPSSTMRAPLLHAIISQLLLAVGK